MTPAENKALVAELFRAWSTGDIHPLLNAMSDDFRWVFPGSWTWSGVWEPKSAVVESLLLGQLAGQLADGFRSYPDLMLADEDRVVVQARGSATTVRGEPYDNTYCMIFRLVEGSVVEIVEHCDTALVERVLEPPPPDAEGWRPAPRSRPPRAD